jgi:hypothetical protein
MTGIDVARIFGISKHTVYRLDREGIEQELSEQKPVKPKRISIDEISRKKGHHYATIISAPDERKVLEVAKGRKMVDLVVEVKISSDTFEFSNCCSLILCQFVQHLLIGKMP